MQKSAHLVNHHNKFKKHEETLKKQHCLLLWTGCGSAWHSCYLLLCLATSSQNEGLKAFANDCEVLWATTGGIILPTLKQCTITRKITENYRTFALFLHRKRGNLMTPVITLVMLFKQCRLVGLSVYSRVEKQNLCRNIAFVLRLYNNPHLLKAPKQEQCRTSIPTTLLVSHWLPPRSSVCIIKLQANSMLLTFPSICLTNLTNVAFLENTDYPNK